MQGTVQAHESVTLALQYILDLITLITRIVRARTISLQLFLLRELIDF